VGVVELEHGVRRVLAEPPVGRRSSSDEVQVQNVPVMAVVEVVVGGGNDTRSGGWVGSTIPARGYGESHVVSRYGIVRPTEWCSEAAGALAQLGDDERPMRPAGGRLTAARAFGAPRVLARSLRAAGRVVGGDEDLGLLGRPCRRSRRRRPGWSMRTPWPIWERSWSISAGGARQGCPVGAGADAEVRRHGAGRMSTW
jgi:hypothetical protein